MHLVCLITKKFVTMHGHMNVNCTVILSGFTYTVRQFVVFHQYFCEATLIMVAAATVTCR